MGSVKENLGETLSLCHGCCPNHCHFGCNIGSPCSKPGGGGEGVNSVCSISKPCSQPEPKFHAVRVQAFLGERPQVDHLRPADHRPHERRVLGQLRRRGRHFHSWNTWTVFCRLQQLSSVQHSQRLYRGLSLVEWGRGSREQVLVETRPQHSWMGP